MPEWWIERGIGETRCAMVEDSQIIEARIDLDGVTKAGSVLTALSLLALARPTALLRVAT